MRLLPSRLMCRGFENCTRGWNCGHCSRRWLRHPSRRAANADPAVVEVVVAAVQSPGAPAVAAVVVETPVLAREYHKILSQEALDAWLAKLAAAPLISFDT